jgi:tRNA (adenine22-N1)-methyltransferase
VKNNRLDWIVKEIKTNGTVIDVGSDHAQLAIKLLTQGKAKHVYNIEVNSYPYKVTIKNLQNKGLMDKTTNILSDGLKVSLINEKVDYCVIAGIGAKNIVNILKEKNKRIQIDNFIFVPNNHANVLRAYLKKIKYRIKFERIIKDKNYYYSLIVASLKKGLIIKNKKDIYFGPYNLIHSSKVFECMNQKRLNYIKENKLHLHNQQINQELKMLEES